MRPGLEASLGGWLRPLRPGPGALLLTLVFVALALLRTHEIDTTFRLLGEQIRDWRIALGSVRDLPLLGTPSTAGGTTLGPIYYWYLWLVRVSIGPFADNLPHAGGIGIALLQSAADVALTLALRRRFDSWPLALAVVLFAATSPYDLVLSSIIWNPAVATAFAKLAIAAVLLRPPEASPWRSAAAVALAWLAVQAHTAAIFVAAPIIGWVVIASTVERRDVRASLGRLRLAIEVILVLQLPFLVHHLTAPHLRAVDVPPWGGLERALYDPYTLRLGESSAAFVAAVEFLLVSPARFPHVGWLLVAAAVIVAARFRRDGAVLAATLGPLASVVAGFSLWRGAGFQHYWYVSVMPAVALTVALSLTGLATARVGRVLPTLLLVAVVAGIPGRARAAWATVPMPAYGPLVRGSRMVLQRLPEVRAITMPGLHETTDPAFVYEVLGGHISASAPFAARIGPGGEVSFEVAR